VGETRFLPGTAIEVLREPRLAEPPRHVLFDFDGTLSLIREGWPDVMVPLMVEVLLETGTDETPEQLHEVCHAFVMELCGKQTIYQMIRLAEEVKARGGTPQDPLAYKQLYHDRLMARIRHRREALRSGRASPEEMLVPGSLDILRALQERVVQLYLTSAGTSTARKRTTSGSPSRPSSIRYSARTASTARCCWDSATATWR